MFLILDNTSEQVSIKACQCAKEGPFLRLCSLPREGLHPGRTGLLFKRLHNLPVHWKNFIEALHNKGPLLRLYNMPGQGFHVEVAPTEDDPHLGAWQAGHLDTIMALTSL